MQHACRKQNAMLQSAKIRWLRHTPAIMARHDARAARAAATPPAPALRRLRPALFIEAVEGMQGPDRELGEGGVDQQRKLDFRGRDGADIDAAVGERPERIGRYPGMAAHADPDDRDLG